MRGAAQVRYLGPWAWFGVWVWGRPFGCMVCASGLWCPSACCVTYGWVGFCCAVTRDCTSIGVAAFQAWCVSGSSAIMCAPPSLVVTAKSSALGTSSPSFYK
eukprot:scaffold25527_cov31-Tisochrysis_lutea.AAC.3